MEKSALKTFTFLNLIVPLIFIGGCGTVKVPVKVTHPAEINMTPYKQIAISDIKGDMG